ncbi:HD domain-containing protein [Candidatus Aenigmatarchaeota archaeon]
MINKIQELAKTRLAQNDDAHGYEHAVRVANLAGEIHEHEGGDKLIITASCYMHDWCAFKGREYHVSEEAMEEIRKDLEALNFPKDKVEKVIEIIHHHEDYDFVKKKTKLSKECQILQDADRLDGLGAIGIGRCFYVSAKLNEPFGTPDDMKKLPEDYHVGQLTSAIRHFYTKLLNLKDTMNTEFARNLAQERHDFMVEFLERLKSEWSGKI